MFVYDSAVAVLEIVVLVVELDVIKFGDVVPCNTLVTSRCCVGLCLYGGSKCPCWLSCMSLN